MLDIYDPSVGGEDSCGLPHETEVVELPILLPGWQATKLETVAHQRGLTAAAMVRNVLRDFLTVTPSPSCVSTVR